MRYRLLVDENVEYRIVHKLRNYGHDVEHVDDLSGLGKGGVTATKINSEQQSFDTNGTQTPNRYRVYTSDMAEFTFEGREALEKEAKPVGGGAHVHVPKDWIGEKVAVIRLEQQENEDDE